MKIIIMIILKVVELIYKYPELRHDLKKFLQSENFNILSRMFNDMIKTVTIILICLWSFVCVSILIGLYNEGNSHLSSLFITGVCIAPIFLICYIVLQSPNKNNKLLLLEKA